VQIIAEESMEVILIWASGWLWRWNTCMKYDNGFAKRKQRSGAAG
jgi:hypothetical protein